jgi:membrane-associated HD superfamily phosphohydrolase
MKKMRRIIVLMLIMTALISLNSFGVYAKNNDKNNVLSNSENIVTNNEEKSDLKATNKEEKNDSNSINDEYDEYALVEKIIEEANAQIYERIDYWQQVAEIEPPTSKKESKKYKYMSTKDIIENLLYETNKISEITRKKLSRMGYDSICDWIEVQIRDVIVEVDPLRLLSVRRRK